jgi:FAD/FMN-containing dehydrogenase
MNENDLIPDLRSLVHGRVVAPGDDDYDTLRAVMLGGVDVHPAAIVRVADAADVSAVVGYARDHDLELAVRSGGHSAASHSTVEDGVVIDLRDLIGIDIDVADQSVWAGGGLTAAALTSAVGAHGLVIGFGDTGSVGIGGITTGGGIGYLVRKYGMTIDSLLAAEIVTADGQVRIADATSQPDLFWAIRGGGGNLGVVTRFRYRLHPLPQVVGGLMVLPASVDTIAGFIAAAEAAPDELSTIANIMPAPPMPFLPEEVHGELVILALMTYAGDADAGAKALAPIRALATPLADMVAPITYAEMFPPDDPDYHPLAISRTMMIDHVDRAVAATILEHLQASDAAMRVAQLRVMGGAMARVPADATAFAHRSSRILVNVASFYEGPEDRPRRDAWVRDFSAALHQGDDAAYVNFVGDEGEERVHAAYPGATWDRLAQVKTAYDPSNLFRRNQNVPPVRTAATSRA